MAREGTSSMAAYEFSQGPAPLAPASSKSGRPLYREPGVPRKPANMMYDRRVVRGNTYAAPVIPPSMASELDRKAREDDDRSRRRLVESKRAAVMAARSSTPEPVPGRSHADIQTETFLEVLADRAPEFEIGVQTEALADRPPTPLFVPRPSGRDVATEIEPGSLFDFDFEVAPLLDVLVGRTLEAALGEVVQEDELAAIRARQQEYSALRSAELAEVQRLEAEVSRKAGERARRLAQERSRAAREAEVQRKVAAAAFARSFVGAMRGNALGHLRDCGYFYSPLRREVETGVLPGIYKALAALTASREGVAAALAEEVVAEALQRASAQYGTYVARLRAEREAAAAEAQRQAEEAAAAAVKAAADAAAAAAAASAEGGAGEDGGGEGEGAAE